MVSNGQIKLINSLKQKKYRSQHQQFLVEGRKAISEFLDSDFVLHQLFTIQNDFNAPTEKTTMISGRELKKISGLKTPNMAVALFKIPKIQIPNSNLSTLVLDDVRDPGNLGTIIRLCDWFGIEQLVCSEQTVDCYNPKVVQATMGSLTRVKISYLNLETFLKDSKLPKYGTFMDGENIYETELKNPAVIIMGNEANGISASIEKMTDKKLAIPQFGKNQQTESLNVATATAIVVSEFLRR